MGNPVNNLATSIEELTRYQDDHTGMQSSENGEYLRRDDVIAALAAAPPVGGRDLIQKWQSKLVELDDLIETLAAAPAVGGRDLIRKWQKKIVELDDLIERLAAQPASPLWGRGTFEAWFNSHFLDPDGGSAHLPDWLKDDLRSAWDAASASPPEQPAVQLQARKIGQDEWINIPPDQVEAMSKAGHNLRAIISADQSCPPGHEICSNCKRVFKFGDTCTRGGCPCGGDV